MNNLKKICKPKFKFEIDPSLYVPLRENPSKGIIPETYKGTCCIEYIEFGEKYSVNIDLYKSWKEDKDEFFVRFMDELNLFRYVINSNDFLCDRMIPVLGVRKNKGLIYFPNDPDPMKITSLTLLSKS